MPTFSAFDGTMLAYRVIGQGPPVVCVPGGPMQNSVYLGDLGGLSAHRQLIMLDLRGTGQSAVPDDVSSYRCDRLVDDVEALREHLGLERMDMLAHSAGANLAGLYAQRYPERVGKLALITPSVFAVGISVSGDDRLEVARMRRHEPWFAESFAALEAIIAGHGTADSFQAIAPFWYGRWDATARAHRAAEDEQKNKDAAAVYASDDAFDPDATRAALGSLVSPVLVLAGDVDVNSPPRAMAELAGLFASATLVVQPQTSHVPWLDDPDTFVATVTEFLG